MACELTTRADAVELPPASDPVRFQRLLEGESGAAAWRIVELFSRSDAPFEAELGWAAGAGSGPAARITVARATRVSVFARSIQVRAANLAPVANKVGVLVSDGFALSNNHWEVGGVGGEVPTQIPVPTFADRLALEVSDPDALPLCRVRVFDGAGTLRASHAGDKQPPFGVPLGAAGLVDVQAPGGVAFRVVFTLCL